MDTDYLLKRSKRRSLSISVDRDARVVVRAPYGLSDKKIACFLAEKRDWIDNQVQRAEQRRRDVFDLSPEQIPAVKELLRLELTPVVEHYAALTGLVPQSVRFTSAKTRLGSCGANNSINFSVYLYKFPPEVKEYVVLHELAHLKHKNHGAAFYRLIGEYMPDYKERVRLIRSI